MKDKKPLGSLLNAALDENGDVAMLTYQQAVKMVRDSVRLDNIMVERCGSRWKTVFRVDDRGTHRASTKWMIAR